MHLRLISTILNFKNINLILLLTLSFELTASLQKDSVVNKWLHHRTYIGITKTNYQTSKAPSVVGQVQVISDNVNPGYSIGYEGIGTLTKKIHIGLGVSLNNKRTQLTYKNFVSPNILSGEINLPVSHTYVSFPLNLYWKIPISTLSSMYIYSGVESFKTLRLKQTQKEYVSIYKNDGSSDNNYSFKNQFISETFSLFRTLNFGLRFELNEKSKNRVSLGINYFAMNNSFPLATRANMTVGNKNFEKTSYLYFEGINFTLGYLW